MARHQAPGPNEFARLVAEAIDREMGAQHWSGRELARLLHKSEGYVRERRNRKYEWSLNDIEDFCELVGVQPDAFIARMEADELFRARFERRSPNVVCLLHPDATSQPDEEALAAFDQPDYEAAQEREQQDT